MRLERIYDHRGLFQREERGIRYFDFLYPEGRVRGYHENNKPKPGEPGDDEDVAIEMDLERDIDDFLGIDPDAPEEDAPDQEMPTPKVGKVDEEDDLGDDSKEDPHLKEKPRRGAATEDGREEYDRQLVVREGEVHPDSDVDRRMYRYESDMEKQYQKPHDERDYWLNQANHEDKEPPKSDSGPERQEESGRKDESGRWESSDGSWGAWNAQGTGVSLNNAPPPNTQHDARKQMEEWIKAAGGGVSQGNQAGASSPSGAASPAPSANAQGAGGSANPPPAAHARQVSMKQLEEWIQAAGGFVSQGNQAGASGPAPTNAQGVPPAAGSGQNPDPNPQEGSIPGKVWNLPNTAVGLVWGAIGAMLGGKVSFGNNAIQVTDHPGMQTDITLGNTISYSKKTGPTALTSSNTTYADHERAHTHQGEALGPLYLPSNILGLLIGQLVDGNHHGPHNWNEVGPQQNPAKPWPKP
ncbi:MAG: hypothetical protein HQL51_16085 [Magnetococcales bacterium]|nr:hypothetical protein [Magnetococcales bacterium]